MLPGVVARCHHVTDFLRRYGFNGGKTGGDAYAQLI